MKGLPNARSGTPRIVPELIDLLAETVELGTMRLEPFLGISGMRAMRENQPPETRSMVHVPAVRHLMGRHIIQHECWRQDKPPGIGEVTLG